MSASAAAVVTGRRRRGLIAYLTSEVISSTGTTMSMVAVPWFVLITTGSPSLTGLVAFVETLPIVLVQGLGGPLVDRVGARRVAVLANALAAGLVGAIPLAHAYGRLSIPLLLVLVGALGTVRGAASATYVLMPGLAEQARTPIERATGLHDGMNRAATMVGVPLAGVIMAVTSAPTVLVLDAVSFAIASTLIAVFVSRSTEPPRSTDSEPGSTAMASYLSDLREGFGFLRRTPILLAIGVMVLITNTLDQAYSAVLVPVWVEGTLGNPLALGLIGGLFGLGAVIGSGLFAWIGPRLPRRLAFAVGFLVGGAPRYLVLAAAATLSPVLTISLIAGLGVGSINPALTSTEYEAVPRELQARVMGALGAMAWAGMPIGALLGGVAVESIGLSTTLLVFGLVYLLVTLTPFVLPVWRQMDVLAARAHERERLGGSASPGEPSGTTTDNIELDGPGADGAGPVSVSQS